jgi:hypothetical protein
MKGYESIYINVLFLTKSDVIRTSCLSEESQEDMTDMPELPTLLSV